MPKREPQNKGLQRISMGMIRKKTEHHEGPLAELEEISLHQMNITKIELLGSVCKRLRILYLQSNLIERIEGLNKMRDLEYLNLALNNITRIEGLSSCEALRKLDLTVNFIDLDAIEASLAHLREGSIMLLFFFFFFFFACFVKLIAFCEINTLTFVRLLVYTHTDTHTHTLKYLLTVYFTELKTNTVNNCGIYL